MKENKEKKNKSKRQWTLGAIFGKIADYIAYPIIIIAFFSSFFMLVCKSQNLMSPVFGNYFVRILSGSMTKSGFDKNDIVIVRKTNATDLRVGDIIAFYSFYDQVDNGIKLNLYNTVPNEEGKTYISIEGKNGTYPNYEIDTNGIPKYNYSLYAETPKVANPNWSTIDDAAKAKTKVVFHEIIDIKIEAETGALFFKTKGSTNNSADTFLIREHFVVGKYVNTPKFLQDIITFCSSGTGMLLIVVLPISIVVLFELLSVLEQINGILLEKKVLRRQIEFNTPETRKANIGIEMREADRAYLYDVMPMKYKGELFEFLWGWQGDLIKRKNQKSLTTALFAQSVYSFDNSNKYWNVFIGDTKSKRLKKQFMKSQQSALTDKYAKVEFKDYQNNTDNSIAEIDKKETVVIPTINNIPKKPELKEKKEKVIKTEETVKPTLTAEEAKIKMEQLLKEAQEKEAEIINNKTKVKKAEENIIDKEIEELFKKHNKKKK